MEQLMETLEHAQKLTGNGVPIMILMRTDMGYGVDFMTGTHKWHGVAPNDEQLEMALAQLDGSLGDYMN
jgi:transketolase